MSPELVDRIRRRKGALGINREGQYISRSTGKLAHLTGIMSMENEAAKQKMLENINLQTGYKIGTTLHQVKQYVEGVEAEEERAKVEARLALEEEARLAAIEPPPWAHNNTLLKDEQEQDKEIFYEYLRQKGLEHLIPKGGRRSRKLKTKKLKTRTRKHKL
jgi:hypothetical protein